MIVLAGLDGSPIFPPSGPQSAALWLVPALAISLSVYLPLHKIPLPHAWEPAARSSFWRKLLWGAAFAIVTIWLARYTSDGVLPNASDSRTVVTFIRGPASRGWLLALGAAAVLLPIVARGSSRPAMFERYPEFLQPDATRIQQLCSGLSWAVYLFGYELLFRGLILHACIDSMGIVAGIAAHTALYVLAHLHKPAGETLSCFLMGPLFAIIMLNAGIVPVWLLHLCIAVVGEQMSGRSNPATRWT